METNTVIKKNHVVLIQKYNFNGWQSTIQTQPDKFNWHERWRRCFDIWSSV